VYEKTRAIYNNTKDIYDDSKDILDDTGNILGDTGDILSDTEDILGNTEDILGNAKDIHNDTKNILVRQPTAVKWPILITLPVDRKVQFWRSWSLCAMQGTRLVIMKHASLGLENLFSRTSCSGPRPLRTGMCFG